MGAPLKLRGPFFKKRGPKKIFELLCTVYSKVIFMRHFYRIAEIPQSRALEQTLEELYTVVLSDVQYIHHLPGDPVSCSS